MSGGIDSSVRSALCGARARAGARVTASSCRSAIPPDSAPRAAAARRAPRHRVRGARHRAGARGASAATSWRDEAIRSVFPEYGDGWKNKIVITRRPRRPHQPLQAGGADAGRARSTSERLGLQGVPADRRGHQLTSSASARRVEYFHADRLNYAVIGTPNRLEYDQGFFVKNGDGTRRREADRAPVQDAGVRAGAPPRSCPSEICAAMPTTDTYSLPQGQDEFYFALPYRADGPGAVGAQPRRAARPSSPRCSSITEAAGDTTSTTTSRPSGARRATCTTRRC